MQQIYLQIGSWRAGIRQIGLRRRGKTRHTHKLSFLTISTSDRFNTYTYTYVDIIFKNKRDTYLFGVH